MRRMLEKFKKPEISSKTRWRDIFNVYDENFEKLYEFLEVLGTNYRVEEYTGISGGVLELENKFIPRHNQLMIFIDGAVQWINKDYKEISDHSIEFLIDIDKESVIRIVNIESFSYNVDMGNMISRVEELENKVIELTAKIEELEGKGL